MIRRIVILRPDGIWEIDGLFEGPVQATQGFAIVRENKIAVYFRAT